MILREVLHAHIPSLNVASTVRDAVDKMDIYQFPGLVVLDADGAPIGVVTEGDLCRAMLAQGGLLGLAHAPASAFMTADPVVAHPDQEVSDALHLMLSQGLTLLPIAEEGRLSGLVLRVDLMQAMLMDAPPQTNPTPEP